MFPSLAEGLAKLAVKDAVLDMEAVVLDEQGESNFQALQGALGDGSGREKIVAFVFDLLYLDGKELTELPLTERTQKLKRQLKSSKVLRYSDHVLGQGSKMFANACRTGLEGIISKRADAPYTTGRQKSWLKIKCRQRQEFIILGYSDARKGERAIGALYLGYRKDGALRYAGKVGTGFSMRSAQELAVCFAKISSKEQGLTHEEATGLGAGEWRSVHWVKPKLLCEVAFTEWTADGHIRHPSFQGLREDKGCGGGETGDASENGESGKPGVGWRRDYSS